MHANVKVSWLLSCVGSVALSGAFFGEGSGAIFLDDANCRLENHSRIIECFNSSDVDVGQHNCRHREDASVVCNLDCGLS